MAGELFHLWAERDSFLRALDRLPQTFCHYDAYRRNLLTRRRADGTDETVAIDWNYVGIGGIGEEIVPLALATLMAGEVEVSRAEELESVAFEGYLDGLADAGWQGEPQEVRLGFTVGAIRYVFTGIRTILAMLLDQERGAQVAQHEGRSIEEITDTFSQVRRFNYELTAEAREQIALLE